MSSDIKVIIGVIVLTGLILLGGIYIFSSKKESSPQQQKIDTSVLIRGDSPKTSTSSATVTVVEFADFQCPACGAYHPLLKRLESEFAKDLTVVFRHFPLQQHQNARLAAYAVQASFIQGKFWEMHDKMFENQNDWSSSNTAKDMFIQYAESLRLDGEKFKKDIDSSAVKDSIDRDVADGMTLGINSTPTFYINGEKIDNPRSYEDFQTLVKAAILKNPITVSPSEKYHAHTGFKVYLNGKVQDFSQDKYQSKEGKELNKDIHLHDNNGDIIHLHKQGKVLGEFFSSLGITFTNTCFDFNGGGKNCSDGKNTLRFYVNGKINPSFASYVPADLDRILITFGNSSEEEIQKQINSVSDTACIYSEKCPERGTPPTEHCVGGLGSDCEGE